jgi:2-polyprenyl-3-methyl-5-hydroxy-6-metoxy-1,4-benzoquinol methylase
VVNMEQISNSIEAVCNNCGSNRYSVIFLAGKAQINQIVKCSDCELLFAYPRDHSNMERYDVDQSKEAPLTADSYQVRHTADKLPDYRLIDGALQTLLPNKGRLVEVGSYSGCVSDYFRSAGWDVVGIEPDGRAVAYAKSTYDVEVLRGTVLSVDLPDASADAVVMLHVIEHVDDPMANIARIRALLKPGGILAMETPTYDSLAYKVLGRRERSMSCDGHIFFYTVKSATALLKANGFEIARVDKVGRTMSVARMLANVGIMSKSATVRKFMESISTKWGLHDHYLYVNARDMVRIYARVPA